MLIILDIELAARLGTRNAVPPFHSLQDPSSNWLLYRRPVGRARRRDELDQKLREADGYLEALCQWQMASIGEPLLTM